MRILPHVSSFIALKHSKDDLAKKVRINTLREVYCILSEIDNSENCEYANRGLLEARTIIRHLWEKEEIK